MWLSIGLTLLGCDDELLQTSPTTDTVVSTDVTWYGDIEPVMNRVCWRCHDGGGIGNADFSTYESAAPQADLIAGYVGIEAMPPAVANPSCAEYQGHEGMNISSEEVQLFADWAAGGAAEGDPADAVVPQDYALHLTDTNYALPSPQHTVEIDDSWNAYRCFVVETDAVETLYVTGFDTIVDNPEILHHLLLFRDPDGDVGESYGINDVSGGFPCENPIKGADWEPLHAWGPGMPATEMPEGRGVKIEPTDTLVVQLHYYGDPAQTYSDASGYDLRAVTEELTPIYMEPLGPTGFSIPADEVESASDSLNNPYSVPLEIFGVFPHMHQLAVGYEMTVESPNGGSECVVASERWDFHNQLTYMLEDPIRIEPEDSVSTRCTWDNTDANPNQPSDPPETVTYGENTDQEMCFFLSYIGRAD